MLQESRSGASITQPQELLGEWWIPGEDGEPFQGTLRCAENGFLTLERATVTSDVWAEIVDNPLRTFPLICGRTELGKSVSLLHAVQDGRMFGVWRALMGITLSAVDEPAFSSVILRPRGLLGWLGGTGLSNDESRNDGRMRVSLSYDQPEDVAITIGDVSVRFVNAYSMQVARGSGQISEAIEVLARTGPPLSYRDWLDEYARPLMSFFSFATGAALTTEKLQLLSPLVTMELPPSGRLVEAPIEVLFRQPAAEPDAGDPHIFADALFTVPDVGDGLESMVKVWFALDGKMRLAFDMLSANRRPNGPRSEGRFMNAVSALEIAHRTLYRTQMSSPSDHRARLDAIIAAVPEEHRQWLRGRLQFSNEPSLSIRLQETLAKHLPYLQPALGDLGPFTGSVVSTRNYFVHGTRNKKTMADDIDWLRRATMLLEMLVECSVLERLQPPSLDLRANVPNTMRFRQLSQRPL